MKEAITSLEAPAAIGPYSPAIKINNLVFLSGQIPLDPQSGELVKGSFAEQVKQVFHNVKAVVEAAQGEMNSIVRMCIYLTDLTQFSVVNEIMAEYFSAPFPARTTIGVASLPKGAEVEIDAIMVLK